jgi:serine/threonine-protein kinase
MAPHPVVELPRPGPSSGIDTEEGRAFYQDRLRFWAKIGLIISGSFFVAGWLMAPFYGDRVTAWQAPALHLANLVLLAATWLVCRRGQRSRPQLDLLDAGVLILLCLGFGVQVLWSHPDLVARFRFSQLLVLMTVLVGRAIFVPSTSHRTLWLSLAAAAPFIGSNALTLQGASGGAALMGTLDLTWSLIWSATAIAIASVTSAVIYGLRQDVREAQRLGQYTLRERLGAGGMGVVYKASHAMLRRPTAVKLLRPEKSGDVSIRRFEREVQLTASLTHPNTIAIYDYGRTPDGIFYYAMEYLDGIDLAVLVREEGPQPPARVRSILVQVSGALSEAHGVGLIHRDIKPANIILCQRGGVYDVAKVLDFGLVKDLEAGPGPGLTNVDMIAGTPQYLAPEAITSPQQVDARADIYAVGAVAYFLLTGKPVFEGGTAVEVCSHHLHTAPERPSERLGRSVPEDLEKLILACLAKDPVDRPQTAAGLAQSLLDCRGLGTWDTGSAAEWWRDLGNAILEARDRDVAGDIESAPTLSVDLQRRLGRLSAPGAAWPWS